MAASRSARTRGRGLVIHQGEVQWVELPSPTGSGPGFLRPAVMIQSDSFNESAIATTVVAIITASHAGRGIWEMSCLTPHAWALTSSA